MSDDRRLNIEVIGFIGLGSMGLPMAENLIKAGFKVKGSSRSQERANHFADHGGIVCDTVDDVLENVDAVITMVPDGKVVRKLLGGPGGIIANRPRAKLLIDMSTIAPADAELIGQKCLNADLHFLDAPVSGGIQGAKNGTLSIMVGGDERTLEQSRPLFDPLGTVTHMGVVGSGQVTKAANQLVVGGTLAVLSEAVALLEAHGVDASRGLNALSGGLAGSRILDLKGEKLVERDFSPTFTVALHSKDMQIVLETAQSVQRVVPTASTVAGLFSIAQANGMGQLDHSAIVLVNDILNGIKNKESECDD